MKPDSSSALVLEPTSKIDAHGLSSTMRPRRVFRPTYMAYLFFSLCSSLYLLPFMRILLRGTDEGTLIDGAVRIIHGQVFARDFFEVMGPGTFYWLALFMKLFGVNFIATRVCLFLTSLGTGLLMFFLSRRICKTYTVLPCLLLAATSFRILWPSHHIDSNFFALASIACCVIWLGKRDARILFLAGLLAGMTTLFHQPKGILLLCALCFWLWIEHRRDTVSRNVFRTLAAGYLCIAVMVLLYFTRCSALQKLLYINAIWPFHHYGQVNNVRYAQNLISTYWDSSSNPTVAGAVLITPLLFVAVLPGLLMILNLRLLRFISITPTLTLYSLSGWALWLAEIHRQDIFHLVFGSPLLIVLCVFYLERLHDKWSIYVLQWLAISSTCLAIFNLFLALTAHSVQTRVGSVAMFTDDPILTLLEKNTTRGQEIFAYPYCPMYYFLSDTVNPTRYSFLMYDYNVPSQFEEVVQILNQRRVKYVVWNTAFEDSASHSFFSLADLPHTQHIVEPYLVERYRVVWADANTRLLERKPEADQK